MKVSRKEEQYYVKQKKTSKISHNCKIYKIHSKLSAFIFSNLPSSPNNSKHKKVIQTSAAKLEKQSNYFGISSSLLNPSKQGSSKLYFKSVVWGLWRLFWFFVWFWFFQSFCLVDWFCCLSLNYLEKFSQRFRPTVSMQYYIPAAWNVYEIFYRKHTCIFLVWVFALWIKHLFFSLLLKTQHGITVNTHSERTGPNTCFVLLFW